MKRYPIKVEVRVGAPIITMHHSIVYHRLIPLSKKLYSQREVVTTGVGTVEGRYDDQRSPKRRKGMFNVEKRREHLEELAMHGKVHQLKGGPSYINKAICMHMNSDGGTTFSVSQKINSACLHIQTALNNLIEAVEASNANNTRPKTSEAHSCCSGAQIKVGGIGGELVGPEHVGVGGTKLAVYAQVILRRVRKGKLKPQRKHRRWGTRK